MSKLTLLPTLKELELISFASDADGVAIHVRTRRSQVPCPECGRNSRRIHSRYTRTLSDLPWQGSAVKVRLHTRRFFCPVSTCPRRIFAERLPETTVHYSRRTLRLSSALDAISLALGGEAGARLAGRLSMEVSPDTMLRLLLRAAPTGPATVPRVLGVDDWAFRKGQSYGTLLVDLEARRPVDVLPDRTAGTLAAWLMQHPGTEIVARDRSTEYSRAIREAAPHVREVADRWHLLHNLRQVLERFFVTVSGRLRQSVGAELAAVEPIAGWVPQRRTQGEEEVSEAARRQRLACYREVRRLHAEEGLGILPIAGRLGISRITVRKYLCAETFPEWSPHPPVPRILQPYEAHLEARWKEGCRNALQLWREIRAQGYSGSAKQVHRWAQPRRTE